jgi:hypothetical protein
MSLKTIEINEQARKFAAAMTIGGTKELGACGGNVPAEEKTAYGEPGAMGAAFTRLRREERETRQQQTS